MLHDASPLLGERSWHKPYRNGIQKQRSVNEVLIAFIKTLTKELKWQKLPFPLKVHINNQKYINNHWGLHYFEGIIQRQGIKAWKDHFSGLFYRILYHRWDTPLLLFIQICSFLSIFSLVLMLTSKNRKIAHFPLKLLICCKNNYTILKTVNFPKKIPKTKWPQKFGQWHNGNFLYKIAWNILPGFLISFSSAYLSMAKGKKSHAFCFFLSQFLHDFILPLPNSSTLFLFALLLLSKNISC